MESSDDEDESIEKTMQITLKKLKKGKRSISKPVENEISETVNLDNYKTVPLDDSESDVQV